MIKRALFTLVLVLVYLAALGKLSPADVLVATALAVPVQALVWRFSPDPGAEAPRLRLAPWMFLRFLAAATREVAVGTLQMIRVVIDPALASGAGTVEVPLPHETRAGAIVTGFVMTLSPGDVVIELDWERRTMLVHTLKAADPDHVRSRYHSFYRDYQRGVLP